MSLTKPETNTSYPLGLQKWQIDFIGGIVTSIFFGAFAFLAKSQPSIFNTLFPNQPAIQVAVGMVMLGFYFGIGVKEKTSYSIFLSGFLLGSLIAVIWIFLLSFLTIIHFALFFGALGMGFYFGFTRPPFGREELDKFLKITLNGVGWSLQLFGISFSIDLGGLQYVIFIIVIVAGLITYFFTREEY